MESIKNNAEAMVKRAGELYENICEKYEQEHVEKLTELAKHMYDERLKGAYYQQTKDVVSKYMSATSCGYKTRLECETKAKKCIREAYSEGSALFDTSSSRCIARDAATVYGDRITKYFRPFMENLRTVALQKNKLGVLTEVEELVVNAERNLRSILEDELNSNRDYYDLYKISYFLDQIEIEKQEFLVTQENTLGRLIERAFAQNVDYSFNGHLEALEELRKDVVDNVYAFYNFAGYEYRDYAAEIEKHISEIGAGLPDFMEGESVTSFLARISAVTAECA